MEKRYAFQISKAKILTLILALLFPLNYAYGAQVTPGSPCPKVKKSVVYKGELFTCIKLGKKKYWNSGTTIVKPVLYASLNEREITKVKFSVTATNKDSCTTSIRKDANVIDSLKVNVKQGKGEGELTIPPAGGLYTLVTECRYSGSDYFALNAKSTSSDTTSAQPFKSPQPTSSPATTPNPLTSALPTSGITYWGQYFYEKCWFAKQFRNTGNGVTLAAQQSIEIINANGTVEGYRMFEIPSLRPKQSMWLATWSLTNQCKSVGRVIEGPIVKRDFLTSPLWVRTAITESQEIPSILSVVTTPGSWPNTSIYKLRIRNNSTDKYLDTHSSEGTKLSFVFLNSQGIPIFAVAGRTMDKVPPLGEATLTTGEYEIGSIELPAGTAKVEPGLIFELCKSYTCNY